MLLQKTRKASIPYSPLALCQFPPHHQNDGHQYLGLILKGLSRKVEDRMRVESRNRKFGQSLNSFKRKAWKEQRTSARVRFNLVAVLGDFYCLEQLVFLLSFCIIFYCLLFQPINARKFHIICNLFVWVPLFWYQSSNNPIKVTKRNGGQKQIIMEYTQRRKEILEGLRVMMGSKKAKKQRLQSTKN